MTAPFRIAIVGLGKIAHDQHIPAIAASPDFELAATVSLRGEQVGNLPYFKTIEALVESDIALDAVAVCTPPQVRCRIANIAVEHGWHVFLEKPPGATLSEVIALRNAATDNRVSVFASWHARYADAVEPARRWLAGRKIDNVDIVWRENVREWHPGQDWIWKPGGFGVFDPGINALSIATRILPRSFSVSSATLFVPENCAAPIAAHIRFENGDGVRIEMDLDFREEGPPAWDIVVDTDDGALVLSKEAGALSIAGVDKPLVDRDPHGGYSRLYRRFSHIIEEGKSDMDLAPLRLVADTFLSARIEIVDPFFE